MTCTVCTCFLASMCICGLIGFDTGSNVHSSQLRLNVHTRLAREYVCGMLHGPTTSSHGIFFAGFTGNRREPKNVNPGCVCLPHLGHILRGQRRHCSSQGPDRSNTRLWRSQLSPAPGCAHVLPGETLILTTTTCLKPSNSSNIVGLYAGF